MPQTSEPTSITLDASALLGALSETNPDISPEHAREIVRAMITAARDEIQTLTTGQIPLQCRIRLPMTGDIQARKSLQGNGYTAFLGQTGQTFLSSAPAAEILGPKAAAKAIGVSRSTLDNWRRAGRIIALPKGHSGHLIPLVQFVHSSPIAGIQNLLDVCHQDATLAWHYLTTPPCNDAESPLDAARAGNKAALSDLVKSISHSQDRTDFRQKKKDPKP